MDTRRLFLAILVVLILAVVAYVAWRALRPAPPQPPPLKGCSDDQDCPAGYICSKPALPGAAGPPPGDFILAGTGHCVPASLPLGPPLTPLGPPLVPVEPPLTPVEPPLIPVESPPLRLGCTSSAQCAKGYTCLVTAEDAAKAAKTGQTPRGRCVLESQPVTPPLVPLGCRSDADCTEGYVCFKSSGAIAAALSAAAGAPRGHCIPASLPLGCGTDTECPPGYVCSNGKCAASPDRCTSNGECRADHACIRGVCTRVSPVVPLGCGTDAECPRGQQCVLGQCKPKRAQCATDGECPSGQVCLKGECVKTPYALGFRWKNTGASVAGPASLEYTDCSKACAKNPRCVHWTWARSPYGGEGNCSLYTTAPNAMCGAKTFGAVSDRAAVSTPCV